MGKRKPLTALEHLERAEKAGPGPRGSTRANVLEQLRHTIAAADALISGTAATKVQSGRQLLARARRAKRKK